MSKYLQVNSPAQGTVKRSLGMTEVRQLVLNGFSNEDRSNPDAFYLSLLEHLKKYKQYWAMTIARDNKDWIKKQL